MSPYGESTARVLAALDAGAQPAPADLKAAVKDLVRAFAQAHPGRTVELRVPPFAAAQCVEGPRHSRGTPPNVVESDPLTWVLIATGRLAWREAVAAGRIRHSGDRSDLSPLLAHPGQPGDA